MMWKPATLFVALLQSVLLMAQPSPVQLSFTVSMPAPASHQYQVVMRCAGIKQDTIEFKMPVWMPGYYQLMNYADKLTHIKVVTTNGRELRWEKSSSNSWKVQTGGADELLISYDIMADRSFVATSYLDSARGYLASPGVFIHPAGMLNTRITVTVEPYYTWNSVATGLVAVQNKPHTFVAPDFDVLYDNPILMGNLDSLPVLLKKVDYARYLRYAGLQATIKPQGGSDSLYTIAPAPGASHLQKMVFKGWLGEK